MTGSRKPRKFNPEYRNPAVTAWEKWLASEHGCTCASDTATGQYLRYRRWYAFMAGWDAAENRTLPEAKEEKRKKPK